MSIDAEILPLIKQTVAELLPDAQVLLFGSRVTGKVHEESDWDILVLTKKKYAKSTKWILHDMVFPLSVQFGTFINILLASEEDWNSDAAYYALRKNIGNNLIAA